MQPKVYKVKEDYKTAEKVIKKLEEQGKFEQVGQPMIDEDKKVQMVFFRELKFKTPSDWVEELELFFNVEPKFDQFSNQYNSIILVETSRSLYLLPNGYAYHTVEKLTDSDFGLSFAERTVAEDDISLKGVTYIQRNKIREITHYKEDQNEFSQATESYFSLSAKPIEEGIFGSNIDCGKAISFSKNYQLNNEEGKENFFQLFNEIDLALENNNKISNFPRFIPLEKKEESSRQLDRELLQHLKNKEEGTSDIYLGMNRIQLAGNKIEILEAIDKVYVHRKYHPDKKHEIGINGEHLKGFIQDNTVDIKSLDDLIVTIVNNNDEELKKGPLKKFVFCQIESTHSGSREVYVLDEGRWGYFNQRFYELLDNKMEEIDSIAEINKDFSIDYPIIPKSFVGEDAYIEKILIDNSNFYKLHKRTITSGGIEIELADIYDSENDELLTIKRGVKTSQAIYSFEQSILGTRTLANQEEFNLKDQLKLKRKNHNELPVNIINKILGCKKQSVLWLISGEPQYVYNGIVAENFKVGDFQSVLLRLKIIDWYTFLQANTFDVNLYFALDLPFEEIDIPKEEPKEIIV